MNDPRHSTKIREAQSRAAEVRRQWSPSERKRRKGLPPDTPWSLLKQLFAHCRRKEELSFTRPGQQWSPAPVAVHRRSAGV